PLPSAPVTAPASAAAATTTAPTATAQGPSDLSSGRRRRAATDQAVPSGRQPPKRTPMIPAGSHIVPIARASVTSSALVGSPLVTPMATFTPGASASPRIVSTSTTEISTTYATNAARRVSGGLSRPDQAGRSAARRWKGAAGREGARALALAAETARRGAGRREVLTRPPLRLPQPQPRAERVPPPDPGREQQQRRHREHETQQLHLPPLGEAGDQRGDREQGPVV